eukprot:scaffold78474_cov60-Phaeocystis_antarctica.AAC.4
MAKPQKQPIGSKRAAKHHSAGYSVGLNSLGCSTALTPTEATRKRAPTTLPAFSTHTCSGAR